MPNPRAQKQSGRPLYEALTEGLLPMLANAARGSVAATVGAPGDILGLLSDKQPLPTSQNILDFIPAVGKDKNIANMGETMGGFVPTPAVGGAMVRAAKTAANPATYRDAFYQAMAPGVMSKVFIGKNAKTWDKAAAAKFEQLEKSGMSNKDAFAQTGTFRSPDGLLRQEIDDASAFRPGKGLFKNRDTNYTSFGEALYHPGIRKAYPDLNTTDTILEKADTPSGAFYGAVPADSTYLGRSAEIRASGKGREELKPTLLHEMQHAIQDVEGFAKGGSSKDFSRGPMFSEQARTLEGNLLQQLYGSPTGRIEEAFQILGNNFENSGKYGMQESLSKLVQDNGFKDLSEMADYLRQQDFKRTPFGQYKRLAGEAEARAVEKRLGYTPEQRRVVFPLDDYDVPLDDLIVRGLLSD